MQIPIFKEELLMKEQILEKLKDEKFVEKLFVCESVEQVKDFFKDSGVEITKEEAQEVIDGMVMLSQKMLSLSEEELEACSGGSEVGRITSNISQEFTKSSWFSKSIYTKQRRINRRNGHWWNSSGRNDFSVCRSI